MRILRMCGFVAACAVVSAALAGGAQAASYSNQTVILVPANQGPPGGPGAAAPYPSTIPVSGLPGVVADANVTLRSFLPECMSDLDFLLVAPSGQNALLASHAGSNCGNDPPGPVTITFDDEAAAPYPCDAMPSGSFKPVDDACFADSEPFPPPAPGGPYTPLLAAVDGNTPNGNWNLFVYDQFSGDVGVIGGGWSLDLLPTVTCAGKTATVNDHVGTAGNDVLTGTPGPDVLIGLGGNDTINGLGSKDVICGGDGNDKLFGGPGRDLLRGEGGKDKLKGQGGKDTCIGGSKPDKAKACEKQKSI